MENKLLIPVKELQVGDFITYTMNESLLTDMDTEEVVGVSINMVHRTVDLRTPGRAIFEIPMDMEIERRRGHRYLLKPAWDVAFVSVSLDFLSF